MLVKKTYGRNGCGLFGCTDCNFGIDYDPDVNLEWASVRGRLLKESPYVTLPALVRFCHMSGIPVVYIKTFPLKPARWQDGADAPAGPLLS
jgi:hypothetical protein